MFGLAEEVERRACCGPLLISLSPPLPANRGARRFTSYTSSAWSGFRSSRPRVTSTPALFTRMSRPPNCSAALRTDAPCDLAALTRELGHLACRPGRAPHGVRSSRSPGPYRQARRACGRRARRPRRHSAKPASADAELAPFGCPINGFRERPFADPAARAGHERLAPIDPESIQDGHVACSGAAEGRGEHKRDVRPASAKASAMAPIPRLAPVTSALRPSIRNRSRMVSWGRGGARRA